MSVNPGFGGQAFIESSVDKIALTRSLTPRSFVDLRREHPTKTCWPGYSRIVDTTVCRPRARSRPSEPSESLKHKPYKRFEHERPNQLDGLQGAYPCRQRWTLPPADGPGRPFEVLPGCEGLCRREDSDRPTILRPSSATTACPIRYWLTTALPGAATLTTPSPH